MKEKKVELIVTRTRLEGKRYELHELITGWKGNFETMQKVQDHIEMWFAGFVTEWNIK